MDNVTHALAGVLVAEVALGVRERSTERSARRARQAYAVSALANNVPDLDVFYDGVVTPGKLGYLLHHRGHTHTILVGVLLGLAVAVAALAIARLRGRSLPRADRRMLLLLGGIGPVVHLAMDGWNNYGIHPFWPVYDGWLYGDTMFILEPLLWITALVPLISLRRAKWWRALLASLVAAVLALPWLLPALVPLPIRLGLIAVAAASAGMTYAFVRGKTMSVAGRGLAFGGWAIVLLLFAVTSRVAERAFSRQIQAEQPPLVLHDVTLAPLPANPLCFHAVAVATSADGEIVVRHAVVAPLAALLPADRCPMPLERTTAPLDEPRDGTRSDIRELGEFRAPLLELRELAQRCDVAAAMRFMRAPFWLERDGKLVVGDARYDRDASLDFAEVELPSRAEPEHVVCPRNVPPWLPPRRALLEGPGGP